MRKGMIKIVAAVRVLGLLAVAGTAAEARALTPADTRIRNQAVATYTDARGRVQETTSNEVITRVLPVHALEILPDVSGGFTPGDFSGDSPALSQAAAPGNTVYYSYTLANRGNAADTFILKYITRPEGGNAIEPGAVRVYQDISGSGRVDSGDLLLTGSDSVDSGVWGTVETFPVNAGETIHLLVAIEVPNSALADRFIDVDIDARSTSDAAQTDAVGNFSRTTITDKGVLTAAKAVSQTTAKGGDTVTYTLSGSNSGNAPVYGRDFAGLNVTVDGSPVADGWLVLDIFTPGKYDLSTFDPNHVAYGPARAEVIYYDAGNNAWTNDLPAENDFQGIGLLIDTDGAGGEGEIALVSGQSYSLDFSLRLRDDLTAGSVSNEFTVHYHDGADPREVESNTTLIHIAGPGAVVPGVAIGPDGAPELGDDSGQDAAGNMDAASGALAGIEAGAGETVVFSNTVRNLGNIIDAFDITIEENQISGASIFLYQADGFTPLTDTSGSGVRDTGLMEPGQDLDIVVRVRVPAGHDDADGPFRVKLRATSNNLDGEGNPAISDTCNVLGDILSAGVTVEENQSKTVLPGHYVDFAVDVTNIRADSIVTRAVDTYNLELTDLPEGWTAVIYRAVVPLDLVPLANTDDLDPGATQALTVRVFAPEDAGGGEAPTITLTAVSTNNPQISDSVELSLAVETRYGVRIFPDNTGVAVRGGAYSYEHVVTNVGNETEELRVTAEFPETGAGWSYSFIGPDGTNRGEEIVFSEVGAGGSETLRVRVFVPANAPVGSVAILNVTVTGAESGDTDTAINATTVIDGNLRLTKTATPEQVKPTLPEADGEAEFHPITYTTGFLNLGSAAVGDVFIIDAVPAETRLVVKNDAADGVTAPSQTEILYYSTDGGTGWSEWGGGPTAAPDHTNSTITHLKWKFDEVEAGADGSVEFQVLVGAGHPAF